MSQPSNQSRCANCGRAFPSHASYCPRCGRSVNDAATPVVMAPPPSIRLDQMAAPLAPRPVEPRPLPAAPKKKSGGCGGCGCLLVLLLIVVGLASYRGMLESHPAPPVPSSPPANVRPPRAPDFRSPPIPLLGPMSGSWVSIQSVDNNAVDSAGRQGFRMRGRVHSMKGARIIVAAYVQRSDGVAIYGTDPMYRDDTNAAGVATTLTMPLDDVDFNLFLPRHAVALTSSAQPLWVRPCLFDAGGGYHFCNGTPLQFWSNASRTPGR